VASKKRILKELLCLDKLQAEYVQQGADGLELPDIRLPTVLGSQLGTLEYMVSIDIISASFS
jgi:hypothetical protein